MEEEIKQQNEQVVEKKKSRWLIWLIIVLIFLGVGALVWGLISWGGGVPSPPALPS